MSRKRWTLLSGLAAGLVVTVALLIGNSSPASATPVVTVYKSPTCGCCTKWAEHMQRQGFRVETHDRQEMGSVKSTFGVPIAVQTCHTAVVGDYVVEGHVPADVIRQLLTEAPPVVGIAVPGMPEGSPGMEGRRWERYDVLAFDLSGATWVYAQR
jgi:hypothetical protein